jgi:hypothetical protein
MPRGVYARKPKSERLVKSIAPIVPEVFETDEEIELKLAERFDVLGEMTDAAINGDVRALIVSGPAGLGKSYTIEKKLELADPDALDHAIIRGYVRAPGLFKLLYNHRNHGQVLVFDDADAIFADDVSLNLLKAACDTTERRVISYLSEAIIIDEDTSERLPKSFVFNGTIIFITNMDFDAQINRGHKFAPHMEAMVSRAHYIDLAMKTSRDYLVRIRQVIKFGLLENIGLDTQGQHDVIDYIENNYTKLRELSLRMALKIGAIRLRGKSNWRVQVKITCHKPS